MTQKTRMLQEEPDKRMLARLRVLEKKMGLVLTLASHVINQCLLTFNLLLSSKPPYGVLSTNRPLQASTSTMIVIKLLGDDNQDTCFLPIRGDTRRNTPHRTTIQFCRLTWNPLWTVDHKQCITEMIALGFMRIGSELHYAIDLYRTVQMSGSQLRNT